MFSKNKQTIDTATVKKTLPTIIAGGTHILGNIISDVTVDIAGNMDGNLKADQVNVRAGGKVTGDIIANVVHVYGEVRGLIRAHAVHLYSSAQVVGVIVHKNLTVEDGAFIDAKFKRISDVADFPESSSFDDDSEQGFIESAPAFGNGKLRLIG